MTVVADGGGGSGRWKRVVEAGAVAVRGKPALGMERDRRRGQHHQYCAMPHVTAVAAAHYLAVRISYAGRRRCRRSTSVRNVREGRALEACGSCVRGEGAEREWEMQVGIRD